MQNQRVPAPRWWVRLLGEPLVGGLMGLLLCASLAGGQHWQPVGGPGTSTPAAYQATSTTSAAGLPAPRGRQHSATAAASSFAPSPAFLPAPRGLVQANPIPTAASTANVIPAVAPLAPAPTVANPPEDNTQPAVSAGIPVPASNTFVPPGPPPGTVGSMRYDPAVQQASLVAPLPSRNPAAVMPPSQSSPTDNQAHPSHPIDPALTLLRRCQQRYASVTDYTATLVKQEMLGRSLSEQTYMQAKFRERPFSVYFRWLQPEAGKEVIYVEGQYDNKLLAHGTGIAKALAGTIKLDLDSTTARKSSRHSLREAGIGNLIEKIITRWEFERQYSETEVAITDVKVNGRPCYQIVTVHPVANNNRFMFHTFKVFIDKQEMLPIRMEGYAFGDQAGKAPGSLLECYTYLDLKVNAGLTEFDFSPRNPAYNFSRF